MLNSKEFFDTRFGIDFYYGIGKCISCGLEQTIPTPTPAELQNLYESYYNFEGEKDTIYTRHRDQLLSSKVYRIWLFIDGDISFHHIKGSGRLLDVGCNEGRGLNIYRQNGYEVEGLELNEKAASVARDEGFIIHSEPIEKFYPVNFYDVAVLSNVLEHSVDPKGMLSHLRRILKPSGEVRISCPNSRSWLRTLFGRYWINWHVPFHIFHFSPKTLKKLLEKAGYKDIQIKQATPALWVAHSIISYFFAKRGKPTKYLRNPFMIIFLILWIRGFFFPILWLGNILGRGDCLIVSVKKE